MATVEREASYTLTMAAALLVPVALALAASVFYATSNILVRAGVGKSSPTVALFVSLSVNVVALWVTSLVVYDVTVDIWAWRYFILAGMFAPVLGRLFNYHGIDKLGVNLSIPIVYTNPIVAVVLSMAFLGERLSVGAAVGGLVIVLGGALLGTVKGDEDGEADNGDGGGGKTRSFDRRYLLLPLVGAFFYGASHVIRKVGIDLVSQPILAAAVTTTASWFFIALYFAVGDRSPITRTDRRELVYFAGAGLATSVAIPTIYLAYQLGRVVIVTPVTNASPLFVLLFSYLFFREEELFTPRVFVGTGFVVVGVVLLSLFGGG